MFVYPKLQCLHTETIGLRCPHDPESLHRADKHPDKNVGEMVNYEENTFSSPKLDMQSHTLEK